MFEMERENSTKMNRAFEVFEFNYEYPKGRVDWVVVLACSAHLASPEPHVASPLLWFARASGFDALAVTDLGRWLGDPV